MAIKLTERILGAEYANVRMSDWVYSSDTKQRVLQERVIEWLCKTTGYTGPGSKPTLGDHAKNILFLGPVGTGKDRLCSWLAKVALSDGKFVVHMNGPELFAKARACLKHDDGEEDLVEHLTQCDVLFLSDPAPPGGDMREYQAQVLYRVIDERVRTKRPTWVTLNVVSHAEGAERLTAQVWDRLRSGATVLFCNWKSFRRPAEIINGKDS